MKRNCTFQSNRYKINLHRTETSVIDNEFAKFVAYLCGESRIKSCKKVYVDFFKLTHESYVSSHTSKTSEHFLNTRETKQRRDQEPFSISIKVLRSLKKRKATRKLKMCIGRYISKYSRLHNFATNHKCFI